MWEYSGFPHILLWPACLLSEALLPFQDLIADVLLNGIRFSEVEYIAVVTLHSHSLVIDNDTESGAMKVDSATARVYVEKIRAMFRQYKK
jgi:hypothetical protein